MHDRHRGTFSPSFLSFDVLFLLRSYAALFFLCVFVDYQIIRIKYSPKIFFSADAILFPVCIPTLSVGKHALRKTAYLPNRTCVRASIVLVSFQTKAYIHPNLVVRVPHQFDAFFDPKNASEKNAKNITPPSSIGQLEKRTSSRAIDVVQH